MAFSASQQKRLTIRLTIKSLSMSKPISKPYRNVETYPKDVAKLSSEDLQKYKHKHWYVRYRYYDDITDKWVLKIYKKGINSSDLPIAERVAQLNAAKKAVEYSLDKLGWNPLTDVFPEILTEEKNEFEKLQEMSFGEALDFAVDRKTADWSKNTRKNYKSAVSIIKRGAAVIEILNEKVLNLRRMHYRMLLDKLAVIFKLTANGYNKYRTFLSSLLGELEQFEIIEYNPIEKIRIKKTIKKKANRPPTDSQKKLIIDRMRMRYPNYYRFLAVLYACTLRPYEICALQIKDLMREEQVFRIIPDKERENSKTAFEREVIIPDWLMVLLSQLKLERFKSDWYIFSATDRTKTFTPGPRRMRVNTPIRWWRNIVKKDLKLDVTQYSFKKMAGNDMVRLFYRERVNDLLELPRRQMGHRTISMTRTYVDADEEIMNEVLKRKMPVL
jgi:integrase